MTHSQESQSAGVSRRLVAADRGDHGVRLDRVLLRHLADLPRVSRTAIQRWIESGQVRVGANAVLRASARVAAGDAIEVAYPTPPPRLRPEPEHTELAVLHEDERILVVDKPAGLVVHPSYKHARGTLLNALLGRASSDAAGYGPRLVHRLDRQTSGVLLVAKTTDAHRALAAAWHGGGIRKHYLAIVVGRPRKARGEIRLRLSRDLVDRRRVVASPQVGRESVTRYEVLAAGKGTCAGVTLVRCELGTGRMHQVRVHLAAIGCPIVGDAAYGPPVRRLQTLDARLAAAVREMRRHALHAWTVSVAVEGLPRHTFVAPIPADMRALLSAAGMTAAL